MKKIYLAMASLPMLLCASHALAETEVVAQQKYPFIVKYDDGTAEKHIAVYRALFDTRRWETGGPAVLDRFPPKLDDDRRCHWEVNARVQRDLCSVSRAFGEQCEGKYRQVFHIRSGGSGETISWTRIQAENCEAAKGKINAQNDAAKAALTNQFPDIVKNDLGRFLESLENSPDVASLDRQ